MRLDLISALEGSVSDPPPEDGAASGSRGGFPDVLRSTFGELGESKERATADGEKAAGASNETEGEGVETDPVRDAADDANAARDPGESANPEIEEAGAASDEKADVEEEVDAAGLAAVAAVVISQARPPESVGSSRENSGAIPALDADPNDGTSGTRIVTRGEDTARGDGVGGAAAPGPASEVPDGSRRAGARDGEDTRPGVVPERSGAREDRAVRAEEAGGGREHGVSPSGEETERTRPDPRIAEAVPGGSQRGEASGPRSDPGGSATEASVVSSGFQGDGEAASEDGSDDPPDARAELRARAREISEEAKREQQLNLDRSAENVRLEGVEADLRVERARAEIPLRAPEVVPLEGAGNVAHPVAGMVTETTTTATPGSPAPAAASDAISVQTEWLASRGGGSARLLLNPPDLGEIAIRVTLRDGAVDVVMVAHEAAARSVAEDQSDRLAHAFANRDLRMETFEVRRGDPGELASLDLSQFSDSGARGRDRAEDDSREHRSSGGRNAVGGVAARGSVRPEPPEILSVAPESGVDLRI